ncbi:MAG: long-chain fatty acid--CoA ligase [Armatimonadetes bacterium]|nr:long-chain fatty acid--CoA ligase [Armatimonadota bacterium]
MEIKSLGDLLRDSCRRHASNIAMLAPGKKEFETISYSQLYEKVHAYAGVVKSLGVVRGDKLVILSENCVEWALTDWACQTLGVIVVPIYPTLPADQAAYIVKDCEAKIVVAGDESQKKKIDGIEGVEVAMLRGAGSISELAASKANEIPKAEWEAGIDEVQLDDIATIIYTSGTTGLPKGAMLAHRGFIMLFGSIRQNIPVDENDRFLCFLPMSHVFERTDGQYLPISLGGSIVYAKSLMTLAKDMANSKPTVMLVVPRFLESTMDKILDNAKKEKGIKKFLFDLALSQGKKKFHGKFAPLFGLTNKVVGAKIREKVGGRLRFFVAGGAALPAHVAEFFGAFSLKIIQGYGLTETYSGVCVNHPDRIRQNTVGELIPGVELKIAEDGEILFRGAARMVGYYKLPEETAKAIDADGWFHTGDIGEFDGKYLKITDRKKDLLVLGNGKNVAPQPIENKLRSSHFIQEAVVLGDGMEYCIALIVPNMETVADKLGKKDIAKPSEDPDVKALIKSEIDQINKTLANFEMVKKHSILDKAFSIDSGELTPTLKVKRKVVKEKYQSLIDAMRN